MHKDWYTSCLRAISVMALCPVSLLILAHQVQTSPECRMIKAADLFDPQAPILSSTGLQPVPFLLPSLVTPLHPICSVTDSSNALSPFHAICTPMQIKKNDDNCVITVIPVAPRICANRSAKA
jgi:hypothetical protein